MGKLTSDAPKMEHYHLEVQANPKKLYKKVMLFLASMGEMELFHDILKKILIWAFRGC